MYMFIVLPKQQLAIYSKFFHDVGVRRWKKNIWRISRPKNCGSLVDECPTSHHGLLF
jgi:hypothetical protein